jgi:signal transduction histidine kinase
LERDVRHEINNSIGVILGYLEMLSKSGLDERQLHYVDTIKNSTVTMAELLKLMSPNEHGSTHDPH